MPVYSLQLLGAVVADAYCLDESLHVKGVASFSGSLGKVCKALRRDPVQGCSLLWCHGAVMCEDPSIQRFKHKQMNDCQV